MLWTHWLKHAMILSAGLACLLSGCSRRTPPTVAPESSALPTPTCYPAPQPTGERPIEPTLIALPPPQISPGQRITLTFTGNYLIGQNAIVCGNDPITRYVYSDELPAFDWTRTVEARLGERTLTILDCGYTCTVGVTIPQNTMPGTHTLVLKTNFEPISVDVRVVAP